jgi:hypothetical protein
MIDQNVRYGFLSCFNRTWFVKADINDTICISNSVHCNSGQCLRAFAYFMHCSRSDVNGAVTINNRRRYSYSEESSAEEESDSEADRSSDESYVGKSSKNKKRKLTAPRASDNSNNSACNVSVSLSQCTNITLLGEGRLGSVIGCTYRDRRVAIKFVDIAKGDVIRLQKERKMYDRLISLQGICIPRIMPFGFRSCSGMMVGFGMDCLLQLPEGIKNWDEEMKMKAYGTLMKLATEGGVLHNDIKSNNFGISGDKVLVFDLEDVSEYEESRFKEYKRSLTDLFLC